MKAVALCAALLPLASAFIAPAPAAPKAGAVRARGGVEMMAERSKSLPFLMKPPMLDGSMAGDVGFDPLGLSQINDVGIDLYWLREAELKHCRLGMLAAAGILFVELFGSAPGFPSTKSQMDAFWQVYAEKPTLVGAAVVAISFLEVISGIATTQGRKNGDRQPGDYNFDPLNMGKDPAAFKQLQLKEVKNGRLAMIAAAGMILQGCTTHQGALENLFGN